MDLNYGHIREKCTQLFFKKSLGNDKIVTSSFYFYIFFSREYGSAFTAFFANFVSRTVWKQSRSMCKWTTVRKEHQPSKNKSG